MKKLDDSKFCFISCVNDDFFYDECQLYLQHLNFPQGMCGEIVAVRDAKSMTAGYQAAMEASDAKYKIYLHQDVFVVNKNILHELIMLFRHNPRIGMIGVAGATTLNADRPIWWQSNSMCGKVYSKRYTEAIQLKSFGDFYLSVKWSLFFAIIKSQSDIIAEYRNSWMNLMTLLTRRNAKRLLKKPTESWIICFRRINKQLLQKK